jgi:hypothetical protein
MADLLCVSLPPPTAPTTAPEPVSPPLAYATPGAGPVSVSRTLRLGSDLGIVAVIAAALAACVTSVTQDGTVSIPFWLVVLAAAVTGFPLTLIGASRRRPRGWRRYFLVGLLCNGAVLGVIAAWAVWLCYVMVLN